MRSSDRSPIRRESNHLRVESLEDRHLLSITTFSVEIPRAIPIAVADSSIILVSEREVTPEARPSVLTFVPGATPAGNPDLSAFVVEAGTRSAGNNNEGSALLLAPTAPGGVVSYFSSAASIAPEGAGVSLGEHGTYGLFVSSDSLGRTAVARPDLTGQGGDTSSHQNGPPGFWVNFDPASLDQFLRSSQPFKVASVLFVGEVADADPQTAPVAATPSAGRDDARIIRALRDSESEVTPIVINTDGANAVRLLSELSRIHPSLLAAEAESTLGEQPASSGDSSATASEDGSGSRDSQRGTVEEAAAETPVPAVEIELLASFNPFDRASIDHAIDELLSGLGNLEAALPGLGEARDLLSHALGTAAALTVVEIVRRKIRGDTDDSEEGMDSGSPGLPCFPNRWSVDEI
jgi:hypothetical protein